MDEEKNYYPNDSDYQSSEIANNLIMVGGVSSTFGENMKYDSSNYGKETVDILAPAVDIYTTTSTSAYNTVSGTSFAAPIVSGIAGN